MMSTITFHSVYFAYQAFYRSSEYVLRHIRLRSFAVNVHELSMLPCYTEASLAAKEK